MSFTSINEYCNNNHFDDHSYDESDDLCFDNDDNDDDDEDITLFSWDFTEPEQIIVSNTDDDIILLCSLFSHLRIS